MPGLEKPDTRDGAVLLLALVMLTVLSAATLETFRRVQIEVGSSAVFSRGIQARSLALSAVDVGKWLLLQDARDDREDGEKADHLGEEWARFPSEGHVLQVTLKTGDLHGEEGGGILRDEQGLFPLNNLVDSRGRLRTSWSSIFKRMLIGPLLGLEQEKADEIVLAIKDWVDKDDDISGDLDTETEYYATLSPPYECPNRPFKSLDELALIRGIDEDLVLGREGGPGLVDLCTVYSDGPININTAPVSVLAALPVNIEPDTAVEFAVAMADFREDSMHWDMLETLDWYRSKMAGYGDVQLEAGTTSVNSDRFSVYARASAGDISCRIRAVLKRTVSATDEDVQLLAVALE